MCCVVVQSLCPKYFDRGCDASLDCFEVPSLHSGVSRARKWERGDDRSRCASGAVRMSFTGAFLDCFEKASVFCCFAGSDYV